ncbi:hypothetical protein TBLA_0C05440 [Henningerozyma blattae CBS 6284]|uniref:LYC1 C-terminal domain-containing protein n=1 Tax=Henningerozyma blattae (strain ATCC 34711 / CBS 6284 / DSM 70876 / NBRC 10599 / NRRL Y-10934 / UCD 77-7) TaxID=1071380 RepID=I2H1U0_HENB6|nr:hypothetical protein TBLA_0C05440 [Tetrapisispora blattae CBS 6284]CCH60342.1 hypothetical protein TBLA_0C05440 [Tetrapisispora blattae CBS 6284]
MTVKQISFEVNTDPEVIRFTHLSNGAVWKGPLTLEQYADREHSMFQGNLCQKNNNKKIIEKYGKTNAQWLGLKHFILKDKSLEDKSKTSQIVAGCETLNRIGFTAIDGKIVPILVLCIGGVFTQEAHRGKGYAKEMILGLHKYFDEIRDRATTPFLKNMIITLYSEVEEYYARLGYKSDHAAVHKISQLDTLLKEYCIDGKNVKYLDFDGYDDLIQLQSNQMERDILASHLQDPSKFVFGVKPDIHNYEWFEIRDLFIRSKLFPEQLDKKIAFGCRLPSNSHVIWHHNWNGNSLILIKTFIANGDDLEETMGVFLQNAVMEAKEHNLSKLEFWDTEINSVKYPKLFKILERDSKNNKLYLTNGSLSAYRAPIGFTNDQVKWQENTKFCWF